MFFSSLFLFIDNHLLLLFIWIFLVLPDVVGVRWPDCLVPGRSFSCEPPQPFERSSGQRQRVLVVVLVQVNDGMVGYDGVSRDNLLAMNFWEVPSPMPATDHLLSNPHQLFTRSNYSHRRHALSRTKLKDFYLSLEINSLLGVCVKSVIVKFLSISSRQMVLHDHTRSNIAKHCLFVTEKCTMNVFLFSLVGAMVAKH